MPRAETVVQPTHEGRLSLDHFSSASMLNRSIRYEHHPKTVRTLTEIGKIRDSIRTLPHARSEINSIRQQIKEKKHHKLEHQDMERALGAFSATAEQTIGLKPYDAQLRASLAQIEGGTNKEKVIIEMNTGEGKTLVGALTASTLALEGLPVHVATSNDVLAVRDMLEMGPVYYALGLTVGALLSQEGEEAIQYVYDPHAPNHIRLVSRSEAYQADVVYAKASELGFDYERDNQALFAADLRQRGFGYCIVDEIDDVLDQSQTPLISEGGNQNTFAMAIRITKEHGQEFMETALSRDETGTEKETQVYTQQRLHRLFAAVFDHMREGIDYALDETGTEVKLLDPDDASFQEHLTKLPEEQQKPPYGRDRLEQILRGHILPGEERSVLDTPLLAANESIYGVSPTMEDRSQEGPLLKYLRDSLEIQHMDAHTIANQTIKTSILTYYIKSAMNARLLFSEESGRIVREPVNDPETGKTAIDPATKKEVWEIIPVDEHTHRPSPGTRLMKGLSGAIEALQRRRHPEQHIIIHPETSPVATITYPEFFSMYKRVTGMTATAIVPDSPVNIAKELCQTFNVDDIIHIRSQFPEGPRKDDPTRRLFENWDDKHAYIAQRVVEVHAHPVLSTRDQQTQIVQPILIGAESSEEADLIAAAVRQALTLAIQTGIVSGFDVEKDLQVLHAEDTLPETDVIANAGRNGVITITSMFGRGTDIRLGGEVPKTSDGAPNRESEEYHAWEERNADVRQAGGLHLIANEDDPRRFRQFLGRGGRQQDPRSSERIASLQDRAIREGFGPKGFTGALETARLVKTHWPADDPEIPHIYDVPGTPAATELLSDAINNRTRQAAESRQYTNSLHSVDNEQRLAWYHDRMQLLTGKGLERQLIRFAKDHRSEFPQLRELSGSPLRRLLGQETKAIHQRLATFGEQQRAMLLHSIDSEWESYLEVLETLREGIHLRRLANTSRPQDNNRDVVEEFALASSLYYQQMQERVRAMVVQSIFGEAKAS